MKNSKGSANPFAFIALNTIAFVISLFTYSRLQAGPDAKVTKARFMTKFSFRLLEGGVIVLKARVGEFPDTLNFILDTGCGGISLDSATAAKLNLPTTYTNRTIKGIAELKPATFVFNQLLKLPDLTVDSIDFHINNYDFLSESYGIRIDGIIGYTFLKRFIVKVNYDTRLIEVWKPGEFKYPKEGALMPIGIEKLPVLNASINDSKPIQSSYIFDTGADICFLMPKNFVEDSNVLNTNKKKLLVQAEGLGGPNAMTFTTINEIRLGPYSFKKLPSYIFEDKYNVTRYPACAGVIGNDLLHRFNLIINYADAAIHLTPNSYFKSPFDYAYTGFKIFFIDGRVTIENVVKDSPAEKAGLKDGDIVFGINNNFSNDLDDYKEIICSSLHKLKVSVLRNNQLKTITVSVESVL